MAQVDPPLYSTSPLEVPDVPAVTAIHLHTKAEDDIALQRNARIWMESVLSQPLPDDVLLDELLQNAWIL